MREGEYGKEGRGERQEGKGEGRRKAERRGRGEIMMLDVMEERGRRDRGKWKEGRRQSAQSTCLKFTQAKGRPEVLE